MINRVLIRTKVVQMLYSYLLTSSEFQIAPQPESPGKDRRFAYTVYTDLLLLLLALGGDRKLLSELPAFEPDKHMRASKLISSLGAEDQVRTIILKHARRLSLYASALEPIMADIKASGAYRSYSRLKNPDVANEVSFWAITVSSIIAKNKAFTDAVRGLEGFTIAGFERGIQMAEETLRSVSDTTAMLAEAKSALTYSLDKAYELYHMLLLLPVEITRQRQMQIDAALHKFLPTEEDLNPNMKFVDNELPRLIEQSPDMQAYLKDRPVSWIDDTDLIKRLLDRVMQSEAYAAYMAEPVTDRAADCELWRQLMKNVILPSDDLAAALESKSVYWNDDLDIMSTFVLKTIKRISGSTSDEVTLLPQYKDSEDADFGSKLFTAAIDNRKSYRSMIDECLDSSNWDPERLAFMDMVIMLAAIAEMVHFPGIPLAVTMNEYVEIANAYSTPKSGPFINGILFAVATNLNKQGIIHK